MVDAVEGAELRSALRHVPSPIVVVTAKGREETRGITIGSFTSVALDPPLVSLNVGRESRMYPVMESCSAFAVNVLGEEQAHLAKRFAIPGISGPQQFEAVSYRLDDQGTPFLEGVTAHLTCVPHDSITAGDHVIYVGLVVDVEKSDDRGAILYYQSTYRGVGSELRSREVSPVKRVSSESS